MNRPETQLFILSSIDGKISTGSSEDFDFDRDLPKIPGTRDGLYQYYDMEKETDSWSMVSGKTMEKIFKDSTLPDVPIDITTVVVSTRDLSDECLEWLSKKFNRVVVACSNSWNHNLVWDNVERLVYTEGNLCELFDKLHSEYNCEKLTIQTGGTLTDSLFNHRLIDHINLVIAPLIVGGSKTPTICDGCGIAIAVDFPWVPTFELVSATPMKHNYLHLKYRVNYRQF